jgi:hypothetical protein
MANLIIEFKSPRTHLFGVTFWNEEECKTPLRLKIKDANVEIFIETLSSSSKKNFDLVWDIKYKLSFKNPSKAFINGIEHPDSNDTDFAVDKIYKTFKEANEIFDSLLRSAGKVENLMTMGDATSESIFKDSGLRGQGVYYWLDDGSKKTFSPKFKRPKGINPLFSKKQLLTFKKWQSIQETINTGNFPSPEVDELLKIKAKLIFVGGRRFAVLEATILIEYVLSLYVEKHLLSIGLTKNKVRDHKKEITHNLMLNILLPSTLSKAKLRAINVHISNVNNLRKMRNKIMHEKMNDVEIEINIAKKGIDSSIKLMTLLTKKN